MARAFCFSMSDETKSGKRHSQSDQSLIDEIRDRAEALGATPRLTVSVNTKGGPINPDALVYFGGSVKALGGGKVGGYLVVFGDKDSPDLTGDYFDKETDFGDADASGVYYHHGLDMKIGQRVIGRGTLRKDEVGVWIDGQLNMRDEYEKAVYEMVQAGKMGWSSGTAPHLVSRAPAGKAQHITRWPLGLDASITPTPAEPRTAALALKSLVTALETKPEAGDAKARAESETNLTGENMSDEIKTEVASIKADVSALTKSVTELVDAFKTRSQTPADPTGGAGYVTSNAAGVKASVQVVPDNKPHFDGLGKFLKAVHDKDKGHLNEETYNRLAAHQRDAIKATGMSERVANDGGILLQESVSEPWLERMYSTGEVLKRVRRNPVGANSNSMTFYGVDENSRANGSRQGGIRGYWIGEAGTLTASKPAFRKVRLELNKVAALAYATDEMLEDLTFLESHINTAVPNELRFVTEDAIFNGDGVGKPRGILHATNNSLVTQTKESGQAATTFVLGNSTKMRGRAWNRSSGGYVWYMNQDVEQQIFAMNVGNYPVYMSQGSAPNQGLTSLLSMPMVTTEYNATLGTVGDVLLADMSQYQVIDKGGIKSASSIHVQFLTDEMAFRFTYRVDGAPLWAAPLTPFKGSNTQSPFVVVETRS